MPLPQYGDCDMEEQQGCAPWNSACLLWEWGEFLPSFWTLYTGSEFAGWTVSDHTQGWCRHQLPGKCPPADRAVVVVAGNRFWGDLGPKE